MRIIPLPSVSPPYTRPVSPVTTPSDTDQNPVHGLGVTLHVPSVSPHLLAPAAMPMHERAYFSAPVAHVPTPEDLLHQFPDMPTETLGAYSVAHDRLCVAQIDYVESYVARGKFWKQVNEMKAIIESLQPPPPYKP